MTGMVRHSGLGGEGRAVLFGRVAIILAVRRRVGRGRGGSEKKGFYIVFAAANPLLNGRIFYDTFTEVNRFAINGMSAMSGVASFFMGAKSEEEARWAL